MSWRQYRKTATTWAKKQKEDFTVDTMEGTMQGYAGDYLCRDINGNYYPCAAEVFLKSYVEVGDTE